MEPRIRVLPPELQNQIAAGEVVERPASVVKELVENSIDAGARRVDIDVEGGGRRLVRVVDDGEGMTPADARLALERHATSKLTKLSDLFTIQTMGFRGEALPSIAAVSHFSLVTRRVGADAAVRLRAAGGEIVDAEPCGAPVGTQVEVRDLLWNVPARLKFLKAEPTEAAHVTEAVARLSIAHPDVHFRLRHGGRVALDLPPHRSLGERAQAVTGRRALVPADDWESGVRVRAFLAPPEESQTTSRGISLYVGRRFVRDRSLLHAVVMGYGELLPSGRYPTAVVVVDPPEGTVDVNVHPQKIEVRFARPQDVSAAVRHVIARAIAQAPWVQERPSAPVFAVTSQPPPPGERWMASDLANDFALRQEALLSARQILAPLSTASGPAPPSPPERRATGFFGSLRYLGQLDRTFLVCEAPGELVLIDQHAAHERIAFQRLRDAYREQALRSQRLLFPRTVELDAVQAAAAEVNREALLAIGFELEPFGERTWALRTSPVDVREEEVEATLRELLSELGDAEASRAVDERVDLMFATIACHSVVRAGDFLSPAEAAALLLSMDEVDYRAHCPHGRPVLLRMGVTELARRFGRT